MLAVSGYITLFTTSYQLEKTMPIHQNRKNKQAITLDPKEELISVLHPLRRVTWVSHFIKKVQQPQTGMPKGKNANTEKFILGLALCFCLFMKNHSSLMRYGKSLKNYTKNYALQVEITQASLIRTKFDELLLRVAKKA